MRNNSNNSSLFLIIILLMACLSVYFVFDIFTGKKASDTDITATIEKYLQENPEQIIKSVEAYQVKKYKEMQEGLKQNVSSKLVDLQNTNTTPFVAGNNFDVTIVEFFDYNCGYCKKMTDTVNQLIKDDPKIRIVFRELPILSEMSKTASSFALAVNKLHPEKYYDFHNKLMKESGLNKDKITGIAKNLGIDTKKLESLLNSEQIQNEIKKNHELAQAIGIQGTPAFIIEDQIIAGATSIEELKNSVKAAREKKTKTVSMQENSTNTNS